ncbi:MAG: glycosyltransferase family 39 protein [Candidatus Eisenbacteria bacterium]|uniref:Glycosyltransferase family 39 protein n=1 Tax=Eiseniibacteriota bacterium TaxID=2212470 RepID=A0A956M146_UNCEI|nr:glycosyltransferase family 39 protein [Candidatus Eisenbacteria bacterium]
MAAGQLVLHLLTNGRYGIFRDELYYLACANHLGWGYVDHPPLSIAVLALSRALFGDGVHAIRIVPALAGVFLILAAARFARRLGGGGFAELAAALALALAPGILANTGFYSMNALDLVLWASIYLLLDRIVVAGPERVPTRWWLTLGVLVGLGVMNKLSVLALCVGLAVSLPFLPFLRILRRRALWAALGLAGVIVLPHLLWQIQNDWPTREFIENAQRYKIADINALGFLGQNVLDMQPSSALLWLGGLVGLLVWPKLRERRWIGVSFVAIVIFFVLQKSKPYYLYPAFFPLFAAGAVVWERLSVRRRWRWIRPLWIVSLLSGGTFAAPMAIPVLSPAGLVAYQARIGLAPKNAERAELAELSQHLADRFGWRELTEAVAQVYRQLPPEEQASCLIVGRNYGEAGALLYYGRALGLPPAVSQHNSFYLWGYTPPDPKVVILVNQEVSDLQTVFEDVREVTRVTFPYTMPFERDVPICVCRGIKIPLAEAWRMGKEYI